MRPLPARAQQQLTWLAGRAEILWPGGHCLTVPVEFDLAPCKNRHPAPGKLVGHSHPRGLALIYSTRFFDARSRERKADLAIEASGEGEQVLRHWERLISATRHQRRVRAAEAQYARDQRLLHAILTERAAKRTAQHRH